MIKTTDSRVVVPSRSPGVHVAPDELVLPIRLRSHGKEPLAVAASLAERFRSLQNFADELKPARYRSWTEKLAGKSFGGHGVRYHAEALVLARRTLNTLDFFERVRILETLRTDLIPFDDASFVTLGAAEWRVSNPELHREAVLRLHQKRVHDSSVAFGVPVAAVSGPYELVVENVSPVLSYVQLNLAFQLAAA